MHYSNNPMAPRIPTDSCNKMVDNFHNRKEDCNFPVATTIKDAVSQIRNHNFAIYQVPPSTANNIQMAWQSAQQFFTDKTCSSHEKINNYRRIIDGNLYGYNEPSNAKQLFRAYCSSPPNHHLQQQEQEQQQPWPNQQFRQNSIQVAKDLHDILIQCHDEIVSSLSLSHPTFTIKDIGSEDDKDSDILQQPMKKRRLHTTTTTTWQQQQQRQHLQQPRQYVPNDFYHAKNCPLDYFFYHNKNKGVTNNCSEHVDRGLLICVCLTNVPGLEVLPRGQGTYFCPEVSIYNSNLYQEKKIETGLICIMAGYSLQQRANNSNYQDHNLQACVHRVRDNLDMARLSISYELRMQKS